MAAEDSNNFFFGDQSADLDEPAELVSPESETIFDSSTADLDDKKRKVRKKRLKRQSKLKEQERDYSQQQIEIANVYEAAIKEAGYGWFQLKLFVVIGLALGADIIEIFLMSYVIPTAEWDLCLNDYEKGWLGGAVFVGMLVGAIIWGLLADRVGRRLCLLISLSMNASFAVASAFVPSYNTYLLCRIGAGVGIGASLPLCLTYYSEFVPKESRGWYLSWLHVGSIVGLLFQAGLGLAIIPATDRNDVTEDVGLHSWRVFILVCSFPSIIAASLLIIMPESPRFLFQNGQCSEAVEILANVYSENHKNIGSEAYKHNVLEAYKAATINTNIGLNQQKQEKNTIFQKFQQIWKKFSKLFDPPLMIVSLVLTVAWFSTAFGMYGLSLWFPEYIKQLETENYFTQTVTIFNSTLKNQTFNSIWENKNYNGVTFTTNSYHNLFMKHLNFSYCLFEDSNFDNIASTHTYFSHTVLININFNNTDFYQNNFKNVSMTNVTFTHMRKGCRLEFSTNYDPRKVYLDVLIATAGSIPGCLVSACLMDRLGAKPIFVISMIMSGICSFFIFLVNDEISAVAMMTVIRMLSQAEWNCLDVMTVVLYPTDKRATAFGFFSSIGRIAGVLGNIAFGTFMSISKAVPIIQVAIILIIGGVVAIKSPDTRNVVLL